MASDEHPLTAKIGQRLRTARRDQGLSLKTLSERTDGVLSKSRISNYEQGLRRLGIEEAQLIARTLGTVSPAYLLYLNDDEFLSGNEAKLIHCFRRADERGKDAILKIAESQYRTESE